MGALDELREHNRLRVIDELRRRGAASRSQIAGALSLSRTTIGSVVSDLLASGLVVERPLDTRPAGRGRPPGLLALDAAAGVALGIDLGPGRVRVVLGDLAATVLGEASAALDGDSAPSPVAAGLAMAVLAEAGVPLTRVLSAGVAHDGRTCGAGLPVPVLTDHVANLGALAESHAHGARDVVYVSVSARVRAGLVVGGTPYRGASGIAGALGHVRVRQDGALCRCGNRGCLETVASTPALLAALRPAHGDGLAATDLLALAEGGDIAAARVVTDAGRAIGRPLADLCNALNPELVVVGGELGASTRLLDGVRESIDRYAQPGAAGAVTVGGGILGERAAVVGAMLLAQREIMRRLLAETP